MASMRRSLMSEAATRRPSSLSRAMWRSSKAPARDEATATVPSSTLRRRSGTLTSDLIPRRRQVSPSTRGSAWVSATDPETVRRPSPPRLVGYGARPGGRPPRRAPAVGHLDQDPVRAAQPARPASHPLQHLALVGSQADRLHPVGVQIADRHARGAEREAPLRGAEGDHAQLGIQRAQLPLGGVEVRGGVAGGGERQALLHRGGRCPPRPGDGRGGGCGGGCSSTRAGRHGFHSA